MNSFTSKIFLSLLSFLTLGSFSISKAACTGTFTVIPACGAADGAVIYDGPSDTFTLTINSIPIPPAKTGTHVEFNNIPGASSYTIAGTHCSTAGQMPLATGNPTIVSVTPTPATCGSCDGTITITATSVTTPAGGPIYYQIQLGNNAPIYNNTGIFTNLCGGTYTVTVASGTGCQVVTTTQVLAGTFSVFLAPSPVCVGNTISSFPIGGAGPFLYQWTNSGGAIPTATNPTYMPKAADLYSLQVTDQSNGCVFTAGPVQATQCELGISVISQTAQFGTTAGEITFTVSGGVPPYIINGGTAEAGPSFAFAQGAGSYAFKIEDSAKNIIYFSTQISLAPTALIGNVFLTRPSACGASDGSMRVEGALGSGNYSYQLVGGTTNTTNLTGVFTGLSAAYYIITLTDTIFNTTSQVVVPLASPGDDTPPPQIIDLITTAPSCSGHNGSIYVAVTGGTPPYTYSITGPISQSATSIFQNYQFQGLVYGDYNVSVVDACGVAASFLASKEGNASSLAQTDQVTSTSCAAFHAALLVGNPDCTDKNGSIGLTNVSSPGGNVFSYILNGITEQLSPTFTGLAAGTYTIQIKDIDPSGSCYGEVGSPTTVVLAAPTGPDACGVNATAEVLSNNCLYTYTLKNPSGLAAKAYTYTLYNVAAGVLEVQGPTTAASVTFSNLPELPAGQIYTVVETEDPGANRVADQPTSITFGVGTPPATAAYPTLQISKCLTKKSRKKLAAGDVATFKITVTNTGTGLASTVQVTDTLPSNLIYVPCENTGPWVITANGQTITADLTGSLDAGASSSFKLKVKAAATVTNEATVTAFETNSATASACVRLS